MLVNNEKSGQLDWYYDGSVIPKLEQIKAEFETSSYKNYFFLEKSAQDHINHLQQLCAESGSASTPAQSFPIAEKRDAEIKVIISKDKMSASLDIKGAYGGDNPALQQLKKALSNDGVKKGQQTAALQKIAKGASLMATVITFMQA